MGSWSLNSGVELRASMERGDAFYDDYKFLKFFFSILGGVLIGHYLMARLSTGHVVARSNVDCPFHLNYVFYDAKVFRLN